MKKSLATHNEIRKSRNFQRGNTKLQRAIASIMKRFPVSAKDVFEVFKNSEGYKRTIEEKSHDLFSLYMHKLDKNWEANKINVVVNTKLWNQNLRIDPQWENKENYYYLAEKVSNEDIKKQVEYAVDFLESWKLDPGSVLKKIELIDPNNFDPNDFLPDDVIEITWFKQEVYEKILVEEGEEEAVKYGKWLRGEKK